AVDERPRQSRSTLPIPDKKGCTGSGGRLPQPRIPVGGSRLRQAGDPCDRAFNLFLEFCPQPFPLFLVVGDGGANLGFGLRMKEDALHGFCPRSSAKSWSAALPTARPSRISATRRANSASQASSTPSSSGSSERR